MHYLPRIVDKELATKLASTGAVVIEGPKACGKTETARRIAVSEVLLDIDRNAVRLPPESLSAITGIRTWSFALT